MERRNDKKRPWYQRSPDRRYSFAYEASFNRPREEDRSSVFLTPRTPVSRVLFASLLLPPPPVPSFSRVIHLPRYFSLRSRSPTAIRCRYSAFKFREFPRIKGARNAGRVKFPSQIERVCSWLAAIDSRRLGNERERRAERRDSAEFSLFEKKNFNSISPLISSRNLIRSFPITAKVAAKICIDNRCNRDNRSAKFFTRYSRNRVRYVCVLRMDKKTERRSGDGCENYRDYRSRQICLEGQESTSERPIAIKEAALDERSRRGTLKKKCTGEKSR